MLFIPSKTFLTTPVFRSHAYKKPMCIKKASLDPSFFNSFTSHFHCHCLLMGSSTMSHSFTQSFQLLLFLILLCCHVHTNNGTSIGLPYFQIKDTPFSTYDQKRVSGNVHVSKLSTNRTLRYPPVRISGGSLAPKSTVNSLAYIRIEFASDQKYYYACSGTILTPTIILSAAHCFERSSKFDVSFTKVFLSGVNGITGGKGFDVRFVDVFKTFSSTKTSIQHDIAIIKLYKKIKLPFQNVFVPKPKFKLPPRSIVYAAGFGRLYHDGPSSSRVRETKLRFQRFQTCIQYIPFRYRQSKTPGKFLCATTPNFPFRGSSSVCSGDSGGPLFLKTKIGNRIRLVQVGITSHGSVECGLPYSLNWFTNLKSYVPFISQYAKQNYKAWKQVYGLKNHK